MKILVLRGVGYVGSHMDAYLLSAKNEVTTFDNLSKGYRAAVTVGKFAVEYMDIDQDKINRLGKGKVPIAHIGWLIA